MNHESALAVEEAQPRKSLPGWPPLTVPPCCIDSCSSAATATGRALPLHGGAFAASVAVAGKSVGLAFRHCSRRPATMDPPGPLGWVVEGAPSKATLVATAYSSAAPAACAIAVASIPRRGRCRGGRCRGGGRRRGGRGVTSWLQAVPFELPQPSALLACASFCGFEPEFTPTFAHFVEARAPNISAVICTEFAD